MKIIDLKIWNFELHGNLLIPINETDKITYEHLFNMIYYYLTKNSYKFKNLKIDYPFRYSMSMGHFKVPIVLKFHNEEDMNRFILEHL